MQSNSKNSFKYSFSDIANRLNGKLINPQNKEFSIERLVSLDHLQANSVLLIQKKQMLKEIAKETQLLLVMESGTIKSAGGEIPYPVVEVENGKLAQIALLKIFDPRQNKTKFGEKIGVDARAIVDPTAQIGKNVTIMAGAVVMAGARINDNVIIYPHVTVEFDAQIGEGTLIYSNVVIGERCIIGRYNILYSGVVIGADGYGYYDHQGQRYKIPQIGIVRTGDFVEIGANVCIDRATIDETFIGNHTKFDNLVQIGHNVQVGERCYIVSQVGVSGSTKIGKSVILGGQVGVADHVSIGDNVFVLSQSGIPNDIAPGEKVFGTPARPVRESHRINGALPKLPELLKRVSAIEKHLGLKHSEDNTIEKSE